MSFTDTALDGGHWCSRQDCLDTYRDLPEMLRDEEELLNRQIIIATDEAEAILRARWPEDWPFNSPTPALRHAVAAIATYRAVSALPAIGGDIEVLETGANKGWSFLADMASGAARIDLSSDEKKVEAVRIHTPALTSGKFGFTKGVTG